MKNHSNLKIGRYYLNGNNEPRQIIARIRECGVSQYYDEVGDRYWDNGRYYKHVASSFDIEKGISEREYHRRKRFNKASLKIASKMRGIRNALEIPYHLPQIHINTILADEIVDKFDKCWIMRRLDGDLRR